MAVNLDGRYDKLDEVQAEIDQTKKVLNKNLEKAVARGEKLETLEVKADALEGRAQVFNSTAKKARQHFCLENWKWFGIFLIVLIVNCSLGSLK
jgi:hypothetical protein